MKNHTKRKISLLALIAIVSLSAGIIVYPAYTTNTATVNPNCLNDDTVRKSVSFQVKEPALLPSGYEFQCGIAESHQVRLLYGSQTLSTSFGNNGSLQASLDQQINNGSVSIGLVDMKGMMGNTMFASQVGDTTKRIIDTYKGINQKNPLLHAQLLQISGKTAWANEPCSGCGQQIAYFPDRIIRHSYDVPARIQFYDENGVLYTFKSNMPLEELKKVAESLK